MRICIFKLLKLNMSKQTYQDLHKKYRYMVQCLECHKSFNSDYKKRHEETCHEGETIQVKSLTKKGAPKNPFEAAKRRCLGQLPSASVTESSLVLNVSETQLKSSLDLDEKYIEFQINNESEQHVTEEETQISSTAAAVTFNLETDWVECVGKYEHLTRMLQRGQELQNKIKTQEAPNIRLLLNEIMDAVEQIKEACNDTKETCQKTWVAIISIVNKWCKKFF